MSEAEHLSSALKGFFSNSKNGWHPPFLDAIYGLTAAQASWVPGKGLRSIWEICNHVRFWHQVVLLQLQKQPVDRESLGARNGWPSPGKHNDEPAWQNSSREAEAASNTLVSHVAGLGLEILITPLREGGPSPWQLLHGLIGHTSYHIGQIVLIRRLQESWIVDWQKRPARR